MHFVFVYGTLKKGNNNHYLLKGADFLAEATVPGTLYNFGLPGYVMGDEGKVHGELYAFLSEKTLEALDALEGYNKTDPSKSFYIRSSVTATLEDKSKVTAWVYEINRDMSAHNKIESGVW